MLLYVLMLIYGQLVEVLQLALGVKLVSAAVFLL